MKKLLLPAVILASMIMTGCASNPEEKVMNVTTWKGNYYTGENCCNIKGYYSGDFSYTEEVAVGTTLKGHIADVRTPTIYSDEQNKNTTELVVQLDNGEKVHVMKNKGNNDKWTKYQEVVVVYNADKTVDIKPTTETNK